MPIQYTIYFRAYPPGEVIENTQKKGKIASLQRELFSRHARGTSFFVRRDKKRDF